MQSQRNGECKLTADVITLVVMCLMATVGFAHDSGVLDAQISSMDLKSASIQDFVRVLGTKGIRVCYESTTTDPHDIEIHVRDMTLKNVLDKLCKPDAYKYWNHAGTVTLAPVGLVTLGEKYPLNRRVERFSVVNKTAYEAFLLLQKAAGNEIGLFTAKEKLPTNRASLNLQNVTAREILSQIVTTWQLKSWNSSLFRLEDTELDQQEFYNTLILLSN